MRCLVIDTELAHKLVEGMNSKTIIMFYYLLQLAVANNNVVALKYKDIETALKVGHTTVGNNMRFFIKIGALEKLAAGKYRFNDKLVNIQTHEMMF